jgi:hypothetical protein
MLRGGTQFSFLSQKLLLNKISLKAISRYQMLNSDSAPFIRRWNRRRWTIDECIFEGKDLAFNIRAP